MQKSEIKRFIDCFEYLKKHYLDIFDALCAMLEVFLIHRQNPEIFLLQSPKITPALESIFAQNAISSPLLLSSDIKLHRLGKLLGESEANLQNIEEFFHIISQQKTSNKLYYYSTPLEVNQLLIRLLDIKSDESLYNPCYGMGSVFLSLAQVHGGIRLFGEELDEKLSKIALMIARICNIDASQLHVTNLLKTPSFITDEGARQFDKVLCNPPMYPHMGLEYLKKDARFAQIGTLAKYYSELIFLTHSLMHLKKRGVFIVRNQVLQKTSLEAKVRQKLLQENMIEAIIELPKNIFPLQNHDLSIMVLAPNSQNILHINANNEFFYHKDGKYNRLINLDYLIEIFKHKKPSKYSKITAQKDIQKNDLRASFYINWENEKGGQTLKSMGFEAIRGQRVYGGKNDEDIEFFDVGIADFNPLGFTQNFENPKKIGDKNKIKKYALKPYDILLSLRGNTPKITILGEFDGLCVANTGVLVLRNPSKEVALHLYCYFFKDRGLKQLRGIYEKSAESGLNCELLLGLSIPKDYDKSAKELFEKILRLSGKMRALEEEISKLRCEK